MFANPQRRPRSHLAALLMLMMTPLAADEPHSDADLQERVEQLFQRSVVVDGNVNYFSPSGLGQPDFRLAKKLTGINFGAITLSSEQSLDGELAALKQGAYQGARLIRTAGDLDIAAGRNEYGILFYAQTHFPLHGDIRNLQRTPTVSDYVAHVDYMATNSLLFASGHHV